MLKTGASGNETAHLSLGSAKIIAGQDTRGQRRLSEARSDFNLKKSFVRVVFLMACQLGVMLLWRLG